MSHLLIIKQNASSSTYSTSLSAATARAAATTATA
jgi:hypothetical protein